MKTFIVAIILSLVSQFTYTFSAITCPQVYTGTYTANIVISGVHNANGTIITFVQVIQSFISISGGIFVNGDGFDTGRQQIGGFTGIGTIDIRPNNIHHIKLFGQIIVLIDLKLLNGQYTLEGDWDNTVDLNLLGIDIGIFANLKLNGTTTLDNVLTQPAESEVDLISTSGTLLPGITICPIGKK